MPPMSMYKRLNKAQLIRLCENREIDVDRCKTKADLIELLLEADIQGETEGVGQAPSDDGDDDLEMAGHEIGSDAAEEVVGMEDERSMSGESQSVTALRLQLQLAQTQLAQSQVELERERMRTAGVQHNVLPNVAEPRDIKSLLPVMCNSDCLSFFLSFERVMQLNGVDAALWAKHVPSQLTPRALQVFSRLSIDDSMNYQKVKEAILASYNLGPQAYLRTFRTMKRTGAMNYVNHLTNMKEIFYRFVEASGITDFDSLFDQMLIEQFLASLPANVKSFVRSKEPKNSQECAKYADLCYEVDRLSKESMNVPQHGTSFSGPANAAVGPRPINGLRQRTGQYGPRPLLNPRGGTQGNRFPATQQPRAMGVANGSFNNGPRFPGRPSAVRNVTSGEHNMSYFVRDDNVTCDDISARSDASAMHDKTDDIIGSPYVNDNEVTDCEFLIPLWVDNREVTAIRDSGNLGPVLISENLVTPKKLIPGKYSVLQGAFDAKAGESRVHRLPMARINIRSPWFNYDKDVTIEAAVCSLPKNISCVIGNSLFRSHRELSDIITVRRHTGIETRDRPTEDADTDKQHSRGESALRDARTGNTCSADGVSGEHIWTNDPTPDHRSRSDTGSDSRNDMTGRRTGLRAEQGCSNETNDGANDKDGQVTWQNDITTDHASNEPDPDAANDGDCRYPPTVIDTVNTVTTRSATAGPVGGEEAGRPPERSPTRWRHANDRDQPQTDEQIDTFAKTVRELGNIDINPVTTGGDANSQNPSEFAREQKEDPDLRHLWVKAEMGSSELSVIEGLLYRKVPVNISSMHSHALVIPTKFQQHLIHVSHSSPMSCHLGLQKTYQRMAALFYFPKMRQKIKSYIRCCKSCQMTAPMRVKERQPLRQLDVMASHAFDDVSIDVCGGDLPKTPRNNRWMLVLVDNLSRWVHITPLRSLKAAAVADALIEIFSYTGIPRSIRMDNMPSFRSELMAAVRKRLGIEAKFSAPYHHQSNARVERVHATIENIIRRCARDHPTLWDKLIPYIHFALRSVPHATTGVSPAELVWGRKMRGILEVIRETWTRDDPMQGYCKMSTCEYMKQLNDRIDETLKIANHNSSIALAEMKERYDKSATVRELHPNDNALVLMPTSSNKLFAS